MTKIRILHDFMVPLTEEEVELAATFGLDNVYAVDPVAPGTIIEDAHILSNGQANYNYPGLDYAPWYSNPGDYEVVDD